ncbi:MAG TPA: VCBS repeat-containing protein [Candidatus Acidoferrales bacterium]|jgi:hypothetical protein|nr:VCBS repeat-containing protein [Candidatus Acidoferrales bacterium]
MNFNPQRSVVVAGLVLWWTVAGADAVRAAPVQLVPQVITLPAGAGKPIFADVDGDGRAELLVIDQAEKKVLSYHQGANGFASSPDQSIDLPPQTGWVALCDVEAHPGLELLMSTATGLVYLRQNAGRFEAERHTLIAASQVFTNIDNPILITLNTNAASTNDVIPVISSEQTVLYHRNADYVWTPDSPLALTAKKMTLSLVSDQQRNPWAMGANAGHRIHIQQSSQVRPDEKDDQEPENETIRKLVEDMKTRPQSSPVRLDKLDVDGDGREDLVVWQASGTTEFKTDCYIFLRGADGKLPDRPTQSLHGRGLPIPVGSEYLPSPVADLNGDGVYELVLLEFKTSVTSVGGMLDTAISHGLDWALTIRTFRRGAFAASAEASVPLTMILPAEVLNEWPIMIKGDFNGDGRPDLLTRRSNTQWNVYFSSADGRWFASQPAMTFEAPAQGYITVKDLNGDGLADIIWYEPDDNRLSIFMSPSKPAKGNKP